MVMVMVMVEITMWYLGSLATSCDGNQGILWEEESQPGRRSDTSPQAATWSQVGWGKSFFGASSSPTYHKLERRCQRRGGGWSSSPAGRRSPVHKHRGQIISLSWQADILDMQGVQSACRGQFKFMSPGDYPPSRGHPQQLPWKQNKSEKLNTLPPALPPNHHHHDHPHPHHDGGVEAGVGRQLRPWRAAGQGARGHPGGGHHLPVSLHPPTNTNSYTNTNPHTNTDYIHMKQLRMEGTKSALISFH